MLYVNLAELPRRLVEKTNECPVNQRFRLATNTTPVHGTCGDIHRVPFVELGWGHASRSFALLGLISGHCLAAVCPFAVGCVSLCGDGARAAAGRPRRRVHSGAPSVADRADEGAPSRLTTVACVRGQAGWLRGHRSEDESQRNHLFAERQELQWWRPESFRLCW
jgi:hypothetical protein